MTGERRTIVALSAVCLVNYRRLSWQSDDGELRVTFDRGLASYRPPTDLWARRQALVRSALGVPAAQEASGVLEIKRRGATILLVEQNVVQSLEVAQRAYILDNGLFVLQGRAADIRNDPNLKRAYLGM